MLKRILFAAALLSPAAALAEGGLSVSHSGVLLDADDHPVEASALPVRFRIYGQRLESDQLLWDSGSSCKVDVHSGRYAVVLGSECGGALPPAAMPATGPSYLEIEVNARVLAPRLLLARVPAAGDTLLLGGKAPAYYLDAGNLTGTLPSAVLPLASATAPGALSADDKQKLDALAVTATAPLAATSGPSTILSITRAGASSDGYLASADYARFDAKVDAVQVRPPLLASDPTSPTISIARAGLAADGYLAASDFAAFSGKLDQVALAAGPLSGSGTAGAPLSIARASATTDGYVAAADFADFARKSGSVAFTGDVRTGGHFLGDGSGLTNVPATSLTGSVDNPAWISSLAATKITGTVGSATNFSGALAGDVTGAQAATVVGKLQGRPVSTTAPAANQVMAWNGSAWAPTNTRVIVPVADATTLAIDASQGTVFDITLRADRTLANPTNVQDGETYVVRVRQDATGLHNLAFGSNYVINGGPTLNFSANGISVFLFHAIGQVLYGTSLTSGASTGGYATASLGGTKSLVFVFAPQGTSFSSNADYANFCTRRGFQQNQNNQNQSGIVNAGMYNTTNYYCSQYCCYLGSGNTRASALTNFQNFGLPTSTALQVIDRGCGDYTTAWPAGPNTTDTLTVTGSTTFSYSANAIGGTSNYNSSKSVALTQNGVVVCQMP